MAKKRTAQYKYWKENFGQELASNLLRVFLSEAKLTKLTKEVVANGEALEAQCKEDIKKIKAH